MHAIGWEQGTRHRRARGSSHQAQPLAASRAEGAMSNAPEGTVADPVAEVALDGDSGDNKEVVKEVVDLRNCRPKPNGRSLVWTQRLFLLDPQKHAVRASCSVLFPCLKGTTTNLIAFTSPQK